MSSIHRLHFLVALLLVVASCSETMAVEVTAPLPDLVGTLEYPESIFPGSVFQNVDFATEFAVINSITVSFTATGTAGEADFGVGNIEGFDPEVEITVAGSTQSAGTIVGTETENVVFDSNSYDLSEFLDGTGTLILAIDDVFANDFFLSATVQVTEASATINGTLLIPEPSTALMTCFVLGTLVGRRNPLTFR